MNMHKYSCIYGSGYLKCEKCGKKIKTGVVKNKKYGWICVPCSHEILLKKKGG
jgi:hypothetical protein